jgi:hypothetical protein
MPNATPQDAQIIMQLYDLRRETEMRKARTYLAFEFWPTSPEDFQQAAMSPGADSNRYFRQALSYWEMAVSFVLNGALHEDLFLDNANEAFFLYAKVKPFIPLVRERVGPEFMANIEKLIERSPKAKQKAEVVAKRAEMIGKMLAERRAQAAKQS